MPGAWVWVSLAALLVATPSSAEIFKCTAKSGLPLYQNFPCELDSLGTPPSPPGTGKTAAGPESIQPSAQTGAPKPAPAARAASGGPGPGMTADEVRALWGEPEQILQDEPRSGRVEIWQYANGRVVQVNQKRRVISVQQ